MSPSVALAVVIETGKRRVFASALDWPGGSRSGRDEETALAALLDYGDRFRPVAERAGLSVPQRLVPEVTERVPGNATTEFGAPAIAAAAEAAPLTAKQAARQAGLLEASWATLAEVAGR